MYSSLKSKYPTWLKYTQSFIKYLHKESELTGSIKAGISKWLSSKEIEKVEFISFRHWLNALITTSKCLFEVQSRRQNRSGEKNDFINNFLINEIKAGDLIYDTYLRFRGVSTLDFNDWFFRDIVWRASAIEKLCRKYLNTDQKVYYFGSYSTYINHGISLRLACQSKNSVGVTFGSLSTNYIIHKNLGSGIKPSHLGYHHKYSAYEFITIPAHIKAAAELSLRNRLHSIYDDSMSYMSEAGASNNMNSKLNAQDSYILMLHDFFDSPHIYQWFLFPDFWIWAFETIKFCADNKIRLLIKPHPNQLPENQIIVNELKTFFSSNDEVRWVPKEINNFNLFSGSPKLIISGYGSVAAEATYCGIPVLLAGDHPGANFKIAKVAKTKSEYFESLLDPTKIAIGDKDSAILFTSIHYKFAFEKDHVKPLIRSIGDDLKMSDLTKNPSLLYSPESIRLIDHMVKQLTEKLFA